MVTTSPDPDVVLARLRQHDEVELAYLYGSAALDAPHPRDIDLAVVFHHGADRLTALLALQQDLEATTGMTVDVHDLDELPVDLQFRVIDEGRPVLVRDEGARVRGEVRIMRAYWDYRPYLDRIREATRARLAARDG